MMHAIKYRYTGTDATTLDTREKFGAAVKLCKRFARDLKCLGDGLRENSHVGNGRKVEHEIEITRAGVSILRVWVEQTEREGR